jgi:hypothetical protein
MRPLKLHHRTRTATRTVAVLAALLASSSVAAIAATPHKASKRTLISQADAICKRVNQQTAPYQAQVEKLTKVTRPNYERISAVLQKGVVVEQDGLDELRALPVPTSDTATVRKVWNQLGTIVNASQAISTAVGNSDITAVNKATQRRAGAETVYQHLAHAYGFKYCGSASAS